MKARTSIIVIFLLFIAGVCHSENHVITLSTTLNDTILNISPKLSFETSEQIKEAIDNGIRIQLIAKAQLFIPRKWWFDETLENKKTSLEVFYFTLGKLYVQLWKDFEKLIKFQFEAPKNNKTSVKLRIMLDKSALPTVMQLPILFNSDWDINTPWFQQEVTPQ